MPWGLAAIVVVALAAGLSAGMVAASRTRGTRIRRVAQGVSELASGNLAHRIILTGEDEASVMAGQLNTLADELQADREAEVARDESRRRLFANISHDLRTPITSIAGYVDALQRGLGDEPDRYLAVIAEKTDELARLTDDLFYAARLDAGDLVLTSRPLDLAESVRRCVFGFEPQLAAKHAVVSFDIPDVPVIVDADSSAVVRILSNLVANGLRHGTGMTSFSVAMHATGTRCVVRISNDGPALPRDAESLFRRGVVGSAGGAGLGLSIARDLAERMGATVSAQSPDGGGAAFTLVFPLGLDAPPTTGSPAFIET